MIYILIKILITAVAVTVVSEIAKRSSLLAGLLASIPLTSFLAFMWLYWETQDTQKVIDLSYSIIWMVIPSFTFFIILPLALKLNVSFLISMTLASISTALVYWFFIGLLNRFDISF